MVRSNWLVGRVVSSLAWRISKIDQRFEYSCELHTALTPSSAHQNRKLLIASRKTAANRDFTSICGQEPGLNMRDSHVAPPMAYPWALRNVVRSLDPCLACFITRQCKWATIHRHTTWSTEMRSERYCTNTDTRPLRTSRASGLLAFRPPQPLFLVPIRRPTHQL